MNTTTMNNNELKPITNSFDAVGIAEGFVEESDQRRVLLAWSYIGKHGLQNNLQGFFGRNLEAMVNNGLLDAQYNPNWDVFNEMLEEAEN